MEIENLDNFGKLRSYLEYFFQFYYLQMGGFGATMVPQQLQPSGHRVGGSSWNVLYRKMGRSSTSSQAVTELSSYLYSSELEMQDASGFDILAWSKAYESRFRVLSTMAPDLLTIPMSSLILV